MCRATSAIRPPTNVSPIPSRRAISSTTTKGNCLFYLAVAPRFFGVVIKQLGDAGLTNEEGGNWRRVIIEKPFGHDLDSAHALNTEIKKVLEERQIYRIDHYLGKETVQNLLAFRFSNGIFEPIWNSRYIDHVQITAAETVGVEARGGYYDDSGALRDMVPNHVMQLIAMVAMEPPYSFDADAIRDEKAKVLHAIAPIKPERPRSTRCAANTAQATWTANRALPIAVSRT